MQWWGKKGSSLELSPLNKFKRYEWKDKVYWRAKRNTMDSNSGCCTEVTEEKENKKMLNAFCGNLRRWINSERVDREWRNSLVDHLPRISKWRQDEFISPHKIQGWKVHRKEYVFHSGDVSIRLIFCMDCGRQAGTALRVMKDEGEHIFA